MATESNRELFRGGLAKIMKEQFQVDVRLKANDNDENASVITAHKIVLAGRSKVFKKMFESDKIKTSAQLETVTISEMNYEELEAFVEFIYGDGSALSEKEKKHVRSLYLAGDKYAIPHLTDLCRDELISSLSSTNALNILELAQLPFDKALDAAAFRDTKIHINEIIHTDEFKLFVNSHPNLALRIIRAFKYT